jgi:hypothetical protein
VFPTIKIKMAHFPTIKIKMAPLQTNPKKINHLSFIEEIEDDKDVLLAIQEINRRTRQPPMRNRPKPNTPVAVVPAKISRRGRVAPYENTSDSSNKEAEENSAAEDLSVQKREMALTRSTTPPSILIRLKPTPKKSPNCPRLSAVFSDNTWAAFKMSCGTAPQFFYYTGSYPPGKAPKIQKKAQIRPKQPADRHTLKETKLSSEAPQDDKKNAHPL